MSFGLRPVGDGSAPGLVPIRTRAVVVPTPPSLSVAVTPPCRHRAGIDVGWCREPQARRHGTPVPEIPCESQACGHVGGPRVRGRGVEGDLGAAVKNIRPAPRHGRRSVRHRDHDVRGRREASGVGGAGPRPDRYRCPGRWWRRSGLAWRTSRCPPGPRRSSSRRHCRRRPWPTGSPATFDGVGGGRRRDHQGRQDGDHRRRNVVRLVELGDGVAVIEPGEDPIRAGRADGQGGCGTEVRA